MRINKGEVVGKLEDYGSSAQVSRAASILPNWVDTSEHADKLQTLGVRISAEGQIQVWNAAGGKWEPEF